MNAIFSGKMAGGCLNLLIAGQLNAQTAALLWPGVRRKVEGRGIRAMHLDASGIESCDGAGVALLVYLHRVARRRDIPLEIETLRAEIASLLALYPAGKFDETPLQKKSSRDFVEGIGLAFSDTLFGIRDQIAFLGELTVALFKTALHPADLRIRDFLLVAEASGARGLPIIGLLGFLIGLIMAFQGAVLMAQFGAEIYIADFVGLSVVRELGPLITAIIVAGRTGSAFAAELGTMKVNEEIDALTTMGLDPVRFLVVPRVLAASLMTPLLAIFANLFGMAGGAVVMLGLGFPFITYVNRIVAVVTAGDVFSGLLKAFIFGLLVSSSGCLCGLRTGEGASAVGSSATRAVVSSIVMIVMADGLFAVAYYFLGI